MQASVNKFLNNKDSLNEWFKYIKKYIRKFVDNTEGGSYILRDYPEKILEERWGEFQEIAELAIKNAREFNNTGLHTMINTDWNNILDLEKLADEYIDDFIDKTGYAWRFIEIIEKLIKNGNAEKGLDAFKKALKSKNADKFKKQEPSSIAKLYSKLGEDSRELFKLILEDSEIKFDVNESTGAFLLN